MINLAAKRDDLRFTIQFTANNPRHLNAARYLNQQGRRSKAPYLADTILHYERCTKNIEIENADLEAMIESVLCRLLAEEQKPQMQGTTQATAPGKTDKRPPKPLLQTKGQYDLSEAEKLLGKERMAKISSAADKFRRK